MTEENEVDGEALLIRVREGRLEEPGSWLYVWLAEDPRRIVYVGGTGMPPVLRTWLHLHADDPEIARVGDRYPGALTDALDVVACPLPEDVDRASAKSELIHRLDVEGLLGPDYVGDRPGGTAAAAELRRVVSGVVARVHAALRG